MDLEELYRIFSRTEAHVDHTRDIPLRDIWIESFGFIKHYTNQPPQKSNQKQKKEKEWNKISVSRSFQKIEKDGSERVILYNNKDLFSRTLFHVDHTRDIPLRDIWIESFGAIKHYTNQSPQRIRNENKKEN